ncbi:MAG: SoxR reducing system RseC family protein [Planctomycetes bacterium]|nr:SoxR reducing system RseC family protein [Planctomycetota bacterium]MCD7897025.1 SoxR reducing system RseC family protein [Planctomycetaceae bacterium]
MDDYTIQNGTVLTVEPGRTVVRVERGDDNCEGCHTCALKALCRGRESKHMDLPVDTGTDGIASAPLSPGDPVKVAYRGANQAVAAVLLFLPGLIGLFFGGFLANRWWGGEDMTFLAGCLGGLAAGVIFTFIVARTSRRLRPDVRIVSPDLSKGIAPVPES